MSLRDFVKATALAAAHPDLNGEDVLLRPASGPNRTIRAVIDRLGETQLEDIELLVEAAEVFIPNDATLGMTAIADGDKLDFAMVEGGSVTTNRIVRIIAQDPGGWLLEVHA